MDTATTDMNRTRTAAAAGVVVGFVPKRGSVLLVGGGLLGPIQH